MTSKSVRIATATALLCALGPAGAAQGKSYDVNYAPMAASGSKLRVAFSGRSLFGHNASVGDAIRRCYGHDTTQGGRNQSMRRYQSTYYSWPQAWAARNAARGVDVGWVSVQAGTSSDLGADVCVTPHAQSPGDAGGHSLAAVAYVGRVDGTAGRPYPHFWDLAFAWAGTSVGTMNWIGVEPSHPFQHPLLVNVVFEVQGPVNGASAVQYYLGSTVEMAGNNPAAPGGVTNGNALWGTSQYGVGPVASNAISHTRLFSTDASGSLSFGPLPPFGGTPGDSELSARLAFKTPVLWATNDGHDGAGGPDWRVGSSPVSSVDVRLSDTRGGADTNFDLYWKAPGGPPGVATQVADPTIVFNQGFVLWSATKSSGQQRPTSWDDLGGLIPAQKGSVLLGPLLTRRAGPQTVPASYDPLMQALLSVTQLSLLGKPTGSEDPQLDGLVYDAAGVSHSVMWEGGLDPVVSGVATFAGGPLPIVAQPQPGLVGAKLGLAAFGLQGRVAGAGLDVYATELASSLEVVLQP